jgi:AraC family transcriptional regulator, exoenzyme S synthesis regulatory protein ExsA
MKAVANTLQNAVLKEQFVLDTVFMYALKGGIRFFDGQAAYTFTEGQCGIARKNQLLKYDILEGNAVFEPVIFCFDEPFLKEFQKKHNPGVLPYSTKEACIKIAGSPMIDSFIRSLQPYHKGVMQLDAAFEDLKYEELLVILLRQHPQLSGILFDYSVPQKINLEAFMNQNFRFNVSVSRFAFLTGRSLSAFKRDFSAVFNNTPTRWLVEKRLQEAYFLIKEKSSRPSAIYLDLGFESLSHFSVAFKKQFGINPAQLLGNRK